MHQVHAADFVVGCVTSGGVTMLCTCVGVASVDAGAGRPNLLQHTSAVCPGLLHEVHIFLYRPNASREGDRAVVRVVSASSFPRDRLLRSSCRFELGLDGPDIEFDRAPPFFLSAFSSS